MCAFTECTMSVY